MNTDIQLHPALIKQLLQQYPKVLDVVNTQQSNQWIKVENKNIIKSKICILDNEEELEDVKAERSAEPLKDLNDIKRIRDYFLSKGQYRNHMLFLVGINIGLRIGDLLQLKFGHVINENGEFRENIVIVEEKTNKRRKFALSNVAKDAINLYLRHNPNTTRDMYMFRNESSNALKRKVEEEIYDIINIDNYTTKIDDSGVLHYYITKEVDYMSRQGVQNFLNKAFKDLNINIRHGTHMLRKTFVYHVLIEGDAFERSRNLEKAQMLLGHSSSAITLRYAGLTDDEIYKTYTNKNYKLDLIDAKLL